MEQIKTPIKPNITKQKRKRIILWVLAAILAALILDYFLYPVLAPMGGHTGNRGENGIWLRYKWYFGEYTPASFDGLVNHLRDGQIKYAYCHVRFIKPDGTLKFRKAETGRKLVAELHKRLPGIKVFAWVYVGTGIGRPVVNLSDEKILKKTVAEAKWLVDECGFDGIQWDYEQCSSGDPCYPELLRQSSRVLPTGTLLGACTPMWYPQPVPRKYCWDTAYFAEVAGLCDQIAVMAYDSAMYLPRMYVALLRKQVSVVTSTVALANPNCRVLIGIPSYEAGDGITHDPQSENIRMALKGVREGLADPTTNTQTFAGVSIFAEYTTDEKEWEEYYREWVGGL
jgi:hypothetical protein